MSRMGAELYCEGIWGLWQQVYLLGRHAYNEEVCEGSGTPAPVRENRNNWKITNQERNSRTKQLVYVWAQLNEIFLLFHNN